MTRREQPKRPPAQRRLGSLPASSLSFKILFSLGLVVLILSGLFLHSFLEGTRRHLTESAVEHAAAFAELVRKSVRDGMLRNDPADVQRTVSAISGSMAIHTVRIYDRHGRAAYASDGPVRAATVADAPCRGCHEDPLRPRETLVGDDRFAIASDPDGRRTLRYVEPIYNEPACSAADCHAHPAEARVLGILLTDMPLASLDRRVDVQERDFSAFILVYVLSLSLVGALVIWALVLRPVHQLARGMERVGAGDLTPVVHWRSPDEIGRLAAAFNAMTIELGAARRRVERWTQSLEEEVAKKTDEIRRTEGRLAEAEKLAALGRLTAEIAHEIRNPLMALGGYGRRLQRIVQAPEAKECASVVVEESTRLERLLKDVLDFSSPGRFGFLRAPITETVERALAAFGERCREQGVAVAAGLAEQRELFIDPAQVRRAVDNLISNALDAMPEGGVLTVTTRAAEEGGLRYVVLEIADTGPGIPEPHLARIFEPFWTTKNPGAGTGLGLPITRKIAEAHDGFLRVENRPEGGLNVGLWLPG